jgi:hypothetical protein
MKYCYLVHFNPEWEKEGLEILALYNHNIEKIADILGISKNAIPRGIILKLEESSEAPNKPSAYIKECGMIVYRFLEKNKISDDRGKLLHEAAHVVQDYPIGIDRDHPIWCWMEGIADYCRLMLDEDGFNIADLIGDPLRGFAYTANFLLWLSGRHRKIISQMNLLLRDSSDKIKGPDDLFMQLIGIPYKTLLADYQGIKSF